MSSVRRFSRWILGAAVLLLLLLLTHRFWLTALGSYLVHAEAPAPADMIVVLAGDYHGGRILTAAALVRQGLAPQALISGPSDFFDMHESDLAIPFAVRHGYPESYFIALPNDSRSTVSEAEVVLAELRKRNVHKIDIVTSNFHTRRSGYIYRARAHDMEIHLVAAPDQYFTPDGWWKNRDARKIFVVEWMKTVATWLGM
ncbi:MAG TPA: YdcF family protein [Bryobacteraceae bacterium]|nr:YdcF family protein [Bryobacteraceae bacterium]